MKIKKIMETIFQIKIEHQNHQVQKKTRVQEHKLLWKKKLVLKILAGELIFIT
jgi:hypothetical protein